MSRPRGFAGMSLEKRRAIASKGGKAAHALQTAHQFSPEEAKAAGAKGGEIVSKDRAHMARIGKLGGQARAKNKKPPKEDDVNEG